MLIKNSLNSKNLNLSNFKSNEDEPKNKRKPNLLHRIEVSNKNKLEGNDFPSKEGLKGNKIFKKKISFNQNFKLQNELTKVLKTEKRLNLNEKRKIRLISSKIDKSLEKFKKLNFCNNMAITYKIKNKFIYKTESHSASIMNSRNRLNSKNIIFRKQITENHINNAFTKYQNKEDIHFKEKSNLTLKMLNISLDLKKNHKREKDQMYDKIFKSYMIKKDDSSIKKKIRDFKTDNLNYSINDNKRLVRRKIGIMKNQDKLMQIKYPLVRIRDIAVLNTSEI